jgi:hypothetical protein
MATLEGLKKCICTFIQFSFKLHFFVAILFELFGQLYQMKGIPVLTSYFFWSFISLFVLRFCFSAQPTGNSSKRIYSLVHALMVVCFVLRFSSLGLHQVKQLNMVESNLNVEFKSYSLQNTHSVDYIQMNYECCGFNNKTDYELNSLPLPLSCCSYNNCDEKKNIYELGCNEKIKYGYKLVYAAYRNICEVQGFISLLAALFFLIDSFTKQPRSADKSTLSIEQLI